MKKNLKKKYLFLLISVIIATTIFLNILNKRAIPILANYMEVQTKRMGIEVLRNTGSEELNKLLKNNKYYEIVKNNDGEIESINFDTTILNEALIIVSKNVRKRLNEIEEGKNLPSEMFYSNLNKKIKNKIVYMVPIGIVFNNAFLYNLGPKIPVKIEYSGNVGLDVKTSVKAYGVNSALIEVYVYVEVTQRTILPFTSKDTKLTSKIPIVLKVVKGSVSNYISNNNPSYSLPLN